MTPELSHALARLVDLIRVGAFGFVCGLAVAGIINWVKGGKQ